MKIIKLFTRKDCPNCPEAKRVVTEHFTHEEFCEGYQEAKLELYDVGTADGLAESALHDVFGCPTVLIFKDGSEVKRIIGSVREEDLN